MSRIQFVVCFANFRGSAELKWAPCGPFHPHFDTLAIDKFYAKHARFKDVLFFEVSRLRTK